MATAMMETLDTSQDSQYSVENSDTSPRSAPRSAKKESDRDKSEREYVMHLKHILVWRVLILRLIGNAHTELACTAASVNQGAICKYSASGPKHLFTSLQSPAKGPAKYDGSTT